MANLWTTSLHEANYCMIRLFQSGMFTYDPYNPLVTSTHPHFTLTHEVIGLFLYQATLNKRYSGCL